MTNDEFGVNELEPERKTEEDVEENTLGSNEYQAPTIKEVVVNSVNSVYQGPTVKEIVANCVKVDDTKKRNLVGLFFLILVLVLIGIIVVFGILGEDKTNHDKNYFEGLPKWVENYSKYLNDEYKDVVTYNLVLLDLDFDEKVEALINYSIDNKTVFDIIDLEDNVYLEGLEISNIFLMYSLNTGDVVWYVNTSFHGVDMNLINVNKRLNGDTDFEVVLSTDDLSQFKSEHFALSYELKYTKFSFRTVDQNLKEAYDIYEEENDKINNIVQSVTNKCKE